MSKPVEGLLPGETKADAIQRLWRTTHLRNCDIAQAIGCHKTYVSIVLSTSQKPGWKKYKAQWMRKKRKNDPAYCARELEQQSKRYYEKRTSDNG